MSQYPPPQGYPGGYPPQAPQGYPGSHAAPPAPAGFGGAPAGYGGAPAGYQPMQQQQYGAAPPQPQYQQHAAPHAHPGGAVQPRVVVVSPRFCLPQQVTLIMQESIGYGRKSDDFNITDASGQTYFMLKAAGMSVSDRRTLYDAQGQPCLSMEQKALTLHGTWLMRRPTDGVKVAEVKPSMSSLSPTIKVFMNDGDKEADYVIKGDFRAKAFAFTEVRTGAVIASVKKESKYSNMNAFMMSKLTDAQKYFLTIEAGVDAAFVTALATLVDEIFHDQRG